MTETKLTKARTALLRRLLEGVLAIHEAPAITSQRLLDERLAEIQRVANMRFLVITEAGRSALQQGGGDHHG